MSNLLLDAAAQREARVKELNEARDARGNRLQATGKAVRITGRICTNNFVGRLRTIRNDLKPQVLFDRCCSSVWHTRLRRSHFSTLFRRTTANR